MRVEHQARMIAPAIEALFSCVWEIISKHANKALAIKLKGKWTLVDPQAWRTKRDIRISVGVGAGNKESMQAQLQQIFMAQMNTIPLGVAGPEQVHNTLVEMAKLAGFANPDKFWIDPSQNPPPKPPPPPEVLKIEADKQAKQADMQADQQKFAAQAHLDQQKMMAESVEKQKDRAADLEKARMSEATKLAIAELQVNSQAQQTESSQSFEAQKLGATFQREDQKASQEQAKGQEKDDGMSQLLTNLQDAIGKLGEAMNRPKQVIRGPDGKVIGVQ
jgi:hypothetical protein